MEGRQKYERPPIVEAIIDLRFREALSDRELDRARNKFKGRFPAVDERLSFDLRIGDGQVESKSELAGFHLKSQDGNHTVLIQRNTFGTICLAPYCGWEKLIEKAKENFETFSKVAGRRTFERIGTRFINRIDIPTDVLAGTPLSHWLRVGIEIPTGITKSLNDYSFNVQFEEESTGAKVRLSSGSVPPALLNYGSILLDIDAYFDKDIPTRIDALWSKTAVLREAKNAVFEHSVTDSSRELFQ